jgi:hypothetical protein
MIWRAMKPRSLLLGIFLIALLAMPFSAHHSISAEFDSTRHVTLSGTINNVDWMNPHSYVFVEVKDGGVRNTRTWACELPSTAELARRGFNRASLKVGMEVRLVGVRAKDGSYRIHTDSLTAENSVLFSQRRN